MWIIIFSVVVLALAFIIGWRFPKATVWGWIDVVYYPLAICGVILLFLESVNTRQLATIEAERRDLSMRMINIEQARPEGNAQLSGQNIVRMGGELLSNISKLNRSCQRTPIAAPVCFVVEDLAPIIAPGEQILLTYDGPEDLGDVCDTASDIFSAMAKQISLSGFLMQPIADHYFSGLSKGFDPLEFGPVQSYIDGLRPKLENKASSMIKVLKVSEDDQSRMEPFYEAQILYGTAILKAFEACLRAPESIRSGEYAQWTSQMRDAQTEIEQKEAELRQIRVNANDVNQAAIFRASYWPFLIILALSLKFSKGVAALRMKHGGA